MKAEALFAQVTQAYAADPSVSLGKMFGASGLKAGGKVFAMLVKGQLIVKLPRDRVEALVASGAGTNFDPGHGKPMKEWVAVEPTTKRQWLALAKDAKEFVAVKRE